MWLMKVLVGSFSRKVYRIDNHGWTFKYMASCVTTDEGSSAGGKELSTTVSSLRVDAIASAGLNISRKSVAEKQKKGGEFYS